MNVDFSHTALHIIMVIAIVELSIIIVCSMVIMIITVIVMTTNDIFQRHSIRRISMTVA